MVKNIPKFWAWKKNSPYKVGPSILVGSERSKKISITTLLGENLSAKTDEKVAWWQNFYNQWIFLTTEISKPRNIFHRQIILERQIFLLNVCIKYS